MKTLYFKMLDDGRLPYGIKETLANLLPKFAGKEMSITIAERKETSSDKQRRYYFAVIVEAFQDYFKGQGKIFDKDQMHDSMMRAIGGFSNPYVNPFNGEPDQGRISYNDLTTAQCEGYHELCRACLAEKGVQVMLPNEYERSHL